MPIYDNQISRADMQKMVDAGNTCGKCGSRLTIAWGGQSGYDGYILKCASDFNHDTTTRHDNKREQEINEIRRVRKMDSKALMLMDENTMLARVNMAKFPQDLTVPDKKLLAVAAITYGFDPLMNEISIYQGRPYVSIDGRYRKAQETDKLDGVETRPATKQEREDWQIPEGDYFFRAEVYVKGASRAFVGWGRVRKSETIGGQGFKPVETNPQRMAEKRAEAQSLRKAFHIPIPSLEEIGMEDDGYKATVVVEEPAKIAEKPKPKASKEAPEADKRGVFEKEGRDITKEALAKKQEPSASAPEQVLHPETVEEQADAPTEAPPPTEGPIDLDWLKEQLGILQGKKLEGWTNAAVINKLTAITGKEASKVSEAVSYLTKEQGAKFAEMVQDAVDMA